MRYRKREYSSRDNSHSVVCIMTYFSNTKYVYNSTLAAYSILAGWSFIQWNCYAELSSQSEDPCSIENVFISWNLSFRTEVSSYSVMTSLVDFISKFKFHMCSVRRKILYEVGPILHKIHYVLLPSVQKLVHSHFSFDLCSDIFAKYYPNKPKYLLLITYSISSGELQ